MRAEILENRPFEHGLPLTAQPKIAQTTATREAIQNRDQIRQFTQRGFH
jgi:hypothetical protein